jgi:predicted ABC-type ATPase
MPGHSPSVVVLAGPNGAGKTTAAPRLLKGTLGVSVYVNPDVIAQGLAGFDPEGVALQAARVMLGRLRELAAARVTFAFETTLASRSYVPWLADLIAGGYQCHLVYLWLPSADVAVQRVAERVRLGGHAVPVRIVRRRYVAGLCNFFRLYRDLVTTWRVYDNSEPAGPRLVALGGRACRPRVTDRITWQRIRKAGR